MKIERVRVFGFEPALRAMRNPKESWHLSDSDFYGPAKRHSDVDWDTVIAPEFPVIGPNDMKLALSLIKGGGPHRKFLRQIMMWMDITIPRYCWQELDTYKVSTVRNSCSTMHKLGHRRLAQNDFEQPIEERELAHLNDLVVLFRQAQENKSKDIRHIRRKLKNDLPEGFLQMATYTLSYETVLSIILWRHNHRLDEWHWLIPGSICNILLTLPYVREFTEAVVELKKEDIDA